MAGNFIGDVLGALLGVKANIGGVGFAMLLLILISTWAIQKGYMKAPEEQGIKFWSAMYIPIVVAMSSIQNVAAALSGGVVAVLGGVLAVVIGFLAIPFFARKKAEAPVSDSELGIIMFVAYKLGGLTKGRVHGSAIAIFLGLVLAYIGGVTTGGNKGIADIPLFAGMGLVGGAMFRDFAIVSTAFGADLREIKKIGWRGVASLFFGEFICLVAGIAVAYPLGYTSAVDLVTIGAGVATFVVGPVTGAALGASSEVIAISIAAGVVKSVLVMVVTPFVAKPLSIDNPQSAMAFGGIMGTTSGTAAGMAAVNPKLVPYAAMTATFYTGLGCLLFPSVFYFLTTLFF